MTELPHDATDVKCIECQLNHLGTYYITVRVKNNAGLFTVATTNEIKVDKTAPYVGNVISINDVTSCVTNCTLVSNITALHDEESGMKSCSYAVRNSSRYITGFIVSGLERMVEATGLQLKQGSKYVIVVRCENNVGLVTEVASQGMTLVDKTPPTKVCRMGSRYHQKYKKYKRLN